MSTRGYRAPRPCPVKGCTGSVPAHNKLTCGPHWQALRAAHLDLAAAVLRTWKAWTQVHTTAAWATYADARRAALTALGGERER